MHGRRMIRVPASSANLGPGYDSLAAALALHLELEVEETGELTVESDLPGVPLDRTNLVVWAFESLRPADGFAFRVRSQIPLEAGLGSSAAAIVAGLVAADHIFELDSDLLPAATALEGHPDNVAASLHGGFVICHDGGAERFDPGPGLETVVAIPPERVATFSARAALPSEVPMADAVHNTAHAAMLVLGLSRGDLDLVALGLSDRLHQPRRAHLYPRSMELLGRAGELGAVGASISGAGPAVLFWSHSEGTGRLVSQLAEEVPDWEVRRVSFEPEGATVRAIA
jgi:homoserine kinase